MERYETNHNRESLLHQILEALKDMPGEVRETFILSHYEGRSIFQISRMEGIAEREVAARLRLANSVLYRHMAEETHGSSLPEEVLVEH